MYGVPVRLLVYMYMYVVLRTCTCTCTRTRFHTRTRTRTPTHARPLVLLHSTFLLNTADRIIRVYESGEVLACGLNGEPEPVQKLQDLINK